MAEWMLGRVTRPALRALHRWTAKVPFPVAEALGFGLLLLLAAALAASLRRAVKGRAVAPLWRWLKGMCAAVLSVSLALALLWLPAMTQPAVAPPVPTTDQLAWLCGELVNALNAAPLLFPEASAILEEAPAAAGLTGCAVKAARYPEWMRAASVSGLFVPLTGEALADATAPAPLVPFTAVHELMHLTGIADEGAANIAAWKRCAAYGGAFADSARLWALRYAMGLLRRADEVAWKGILRKMKDPLAQVYQSCGGEAAFAPATAAFPRLSPARGDYAALVGWMVNH